MSNQFNNQKCSKCRSIYVDLKVGSFASGCENHEHFFKKNGQLYCVHCLMKEGSVKCEKCRKLISRYEDLGDWRRNVGLWDDHTADADTFGNGGCWCRSCSVEKDNPKQSSYSGWGPGNPKWEKQKWCKVTGCPYKVSPHFEAQGVCGMHVKKCQGTVFTHHNGGYKAKHGSTQYIPCTEAASEGDFCEHCKGQTETYQQVKDRMAAEQKQGFEKYKQGQEKAQNWWNTLSSSERERECERVVENMKLGKYWANNVYEGEGSGWTQDGSWWTIENRKFVSSQPHLVPIQITEEFLRKELGNEEVALVMRDKNSCDITIKTNNKDNSLSPNLAVPASQSITDSNGKNDNSVSPANSSQPNPEKSDYSFKIKLNPSVDNQKNSPQTNRDEAKRENNNQTLVINLKDIKQISLVGDNLVIEFNQSEQSQVVVSEQITNNRELSAVKDYLQNSHRSSVNCQELANIISQKNTDNSSSKSPIQPSKSPFLWIAGVGVVGIMAGLCFGLVIKFKKFRPKKK